VREANKVAIPGPPSLLHRQATGESAHRLALSTQAAASVDSNVGCAAGSSDSTGLIAAIYAPNPGGGGTIALSAGCVCTLTQSAAATATSAVRAPASAEQSSITRASDAGAALFNLDGTLEISFSTIAGNRLVRSNFNFSPGSANGAIYSAATGHRIDTGAAVTAAVTIANSIVHGVNAKGASAMPPRPATTCMAIRSRWMRVAWAARRAVIATWVPAKSTSIRSSPTASRCLEPYRAGGR
jgi:hypothetical protein